MKSFDGKIRAEKQALSSCFSVFSGGSVPVAGLCVDRSSPGSPQCHLAFWTLARLRQDDGVWGAYLVVCSRRRQLQDRGQLETLALPTFLVISRGNYEVRGCPSGSHGDGVGWQGGEELGGLG